MSMEEMVQKATRPTKPKKHYPTSRIALFDKTFDKAIILRFLRGFSFPTCHASSTI